MTKKQIVEALIDLNKSLDSIKLHNLIAAIAKDEAEAEMSADRDTKGEGVEETEEECGPCEQLKELMEAIGALQTGDTSKMEEFRLKQEAQMDPELLKKLKKRVGKLLKKK